MNSTFFETENSLWSPSVLEAVHWQLVKKKNISSIWNYNKYTVTAIFGSEILASTFFHTVVRQLFKWIKHFCQDISNPNFSFKYKCWLDVFWKSQYEIAILHSIWRSPDVFVWCKVQMTKMCVSWKTGRPVWFKSFTKTSDLASKCTYEQFTGIGAI